MWAEKIYKSPQFAAIQAIEKTGADKTVRQQLVEFFSSLYSQVTREGNFYL